MARNTGKKSNTKNSNTITARSVKRYGSLNTATHKAIKDCGARPKTLTEAQRAERRKRAALASFDAAYKSNKSR